jgi:16S rRNA (cytosine1402-N4)-methyltransferase
LIEIFKEYGEVKSPGRVVKAIVMDRKESPFETTKQLGEMIARVEGWKKKGLHPATLYFMALRIYVNRELEGLEQALQAFQSLLKPGGRLYVISFHSLEDRIVKHAFLNSTFGGPVNRKVILASEKEQSENPRSRSAKLRIFERGLSAVKEKKNKYADKRGIH